MELQTFEPSRHDADRNYRRIRVRKIRVARLDERDEFGDTVAVRVARPKGEGSEVGTEPLVVVLFLWAGEEYQEGFDSRVGDREVC